MVKEAWKIFPKAVMEAVLNKQARTPRVDQLLILHGPRGSGKTTLLTDRLLPHWTTPPHFSAYIDFAEFLAGTHPISGNSFPWSSFSASGAPPPLLSDCRDALHRRLEALASSAVAGGSLTSRDVFTALRRSHSLLSALRRGVGESRLSDAAMWERAVSGRLEKEETGGGGGGGGEEVLAKEAKAALEIAKEVIDLHLRWRANAILDSNRKNRFSRTLASSCTDWPCLLIELLSGAAEEGHFQPKLVINNIEVLRLAVLGDGEVSVPGAMYHDSLIWRIVALGSNQMMMPVIFATSDSYYAYKAFYDFGSMDVFISREYRGWTPQQAKLLMVPDYFSESEFSRITEMLGASPRHLFELYALKQNNYYLAGGNEKGATIEDIIDAYLAYLQISVVNPAIDQALKLLQKFADDVINGKIQKDQLMFGAPWRHPPKTNNAELQLQWAKVQMMDFLQSLVRAYWGLNYLVDYSEEIFDDPAAHALIEVGLIYVMRDPSYIFPVSIGIEKCLARWLVQELVQMNYKTTFQYRWQRLRRGRSYRDLLRQLGPKEY